VKPSRDKKDPAKLRPKRQKPCPFCLAKTESIDYKEEGRLERFTTDRGKIMPRRNSSVCAKHQRWLSMAIKRSRHIGLVPYSVD